SFILRFFYTVPPPPRSTLFPYTTLFRSLGVLVELDEPEPEVPSPVPFEVVDQRPVEVAAEIDAAENRVVHGARRGRDHPGPDAVEPVGVPVLEHVDRLDKHGAPRGAVGDALLLRRSEEV